MEVSRGGYYRYLKNCRHRKNVHEAKLLIEVKLLAKESHNSYGSRRIAKGLQAKGYLVGRYAARTLMSKAQVSCKQRRRYQITTRSKHDFAVAENILNRNFNVREPNRVWVADITCIWTLEGWLYIAAVLDLFSRRIVGWAMADNMREPLINEALQMALRRRRPKHGLVHHSDRGSQYASHEYQLTLTKAGIVVSMSRKGNCWDNAVMERVLGSLKSERTDGKIYKTRAIAKADAINYIEMFYNCKRLHSTLGYMSPMQFEDRFLSSKVSTFT